MNFGDLERKRNNETLFFAVSNILSFNHAGRSLGGQGDPHGTRMLPGEWIFSEPFGDSGLAREGGRWSS